MVLHCPSLAKLGGELLARRRYANRRSRSKEQRDRQKNSPSFSTGLRFRERALPAATGRQRAAVQPAYAGSANEGLTPYEPPNACDAETGAALFLNRLAIMQADHSSLTSVLSSRVHRSLGRALHRTGDASCPEHWWALRWRYRFSCSVPAPIRIAYLAQVLSVVSTPTFGRHTMRALRPFAISVFEHTHPFSSVALSSHRRAPRADSRDAGFDTRLAAVDGSRTRPRCGDHGAGCRGDYTACNRRSFVSGISPLRAPLAQSHDLVAARVRDRLRHRSVTGTSARWPQAAQSAVTVSWCVRSSTPAAYIGTIEADRC